MEMFNKKELDKRIGPLKKNKKLYDLEAVEGYVIRKANENGLEHSYDVMAEEMPYFKTLAYTEYAGNFYLQPLNFKLRNEQLIDAYNDNSSEIVDYSSLLINKIVNNEANKYTGRKEEFSKYLPKDYLVVLPGSNKVRENVCLNRLKYISKQHGDNIYFKPHPITTHQIIGELKDFFGEENILPRDINMYYYFQKAKGIYSISEVLSENLKSVTLDKTNKIKMLTKKNYLFLNSQSLPKLYKFNGNFFIFKSKFFLDEYEIPIKNSIGFKISEAESIDIDNLTDLKKVKKLKFFKNSN